MNSFGDKSIECSLNPAGGTIAAQPEHIQSPLARDLSNRRVEDSLPTHLGVGVILKNKEIHLNKRNVL